MKESDKRWWQATALAVATVGRYNGYVDTTTFRELYRDLGLSKRIMKEAEVDESDVDAIAKTFGSLWDKVR